MNTNFIQNAVLDLKERQKLEAQSQLLKDASDLKNQVANLNSQVTELQDKVVAQPMVASTPAPAPAKSMTLMHVGLLAGGILVGYFLFKMLKK